MNKTELIGAVAEPREDMRKADITAIVNRVFESIQQELARGGGVQLLGFGTFATGDRAARFGRNNPRTSAPLAIAAAKTVKFSAGQAFKDRVNADSANHGNAQCKAQP